MQTQREQIAVLTERLSRLLATLRDIKAIGQYCDNDADAAQAIVVIVRIAKAAIADELAALKEVSHDDSQPDAPIDYGLDTPYIYGYDGEG